MQGVPTENLIPFLFLILRVMVLVYLFAIIVVVKNKLKVDRYQTTAILNSLFNYVFIQIISHVELDNLPPSTNLHFGKTSRIGQFCGLVYILCFFQT